MTENLALPSAEGYSLATQTNITSFAVRGGSSRLRRNSLLPSKTVRVTWNFDRPRYEQFVAMLRNDMLNGKLPMTIDLVLDGAAPASRVAYIVPNTWQVSSVNGDRIVVSVTMEVNALPPGQIRWPVECECFSNISASFNSINSNVDIACSGNAEIEFDYAAGTASITTNGPQDGWYPTDMACVGAIGMNNFFGIPKIGATVNLVSGLNGNAGIYVFPTTTPDLNTGIIGVRVQSTGEARYLTALNSITQIPGFSGTSGEFSAMGAGTGFTSNFFSYQGGNTAIWYKPGFAGAKYGHRDTSGNNEIVIGQGGINRLERSVWQTSSVGLYAYGDGPTTATFSGIEVFDCFPFAAIFPTDAPDPISDPFSGPTRWLTEFDDGEAGLLSPEQSEGGRWVAQEDQTVIVFTEVASVTQSGGQEWTIEILINGFVALSTQSRSSS
ncbi:MAG: hypothetical protein F6K62_19360, partial [Sphaerospermopsis sp. SIO1G2]|nr:hypothetical protein [Sphaerospermopsis sp. SIO1G2]